MHPFGALDFQESPPRGSAARWKEMAPEGFLIALISIRRGPLRYRMAPVEIGTSAPERICGLRCHLVSAGRDERLSKMLLNHICLRGTIRFIWEGG